MARDEKKVRAARWIWIGLGAIVLLIPLGIWITTIAPRSARRARLEDHFTRALAEHRAQRWERPVLRGEPLAGSAWDAQVEAIVPLVAVPAEALEGLAQQLARHGAPTLGQRALVQEHASELAAYRRSTQRGASWGTYELERGAAAASVDYIPHLRASRLLAVQAAASPPAECLAISADVIRLAQDRVPGMGLVPLMVHAVQVREILPVAARCIDAAERATLETAERELAILARHPAPTGSAMETEALFGAGVMRAELALTPSLPTDGAGMERWWNASDMLEAWELLMGEPASQRTIGADYPADLERVAERRLELEARGNDVLALGLIDITRFLRRDASARAVVRMLWAAARLRLAHDAPPDGVPALLSLVELLDPTSGAPFAWTHEGATATLASATAAEGLDVDAITVRITWR